MEHEDLPLDVGEKDDHVQAIPCLASIEDGGYDRETVFYWDDWDEVIFKFERGRGWEEEEDYNSSDEEYNDNCKTVGPCRNDFGHKAELRFQYHYGEDGKEGDIFGNREEFRNYERPPSFLTETTQQEFYSETLTKLRATKCQIKTLWKNAKNWRFQDGRIPGFIQDPIKKMNTAVRQATSSVYITVDKLKYDTDRLGVRNVTKDPHAVEQSVEPKWDMAGIITQLTHLVLMTRYQVVKMRQYITESKEWLTACDWKKVLPKLGFIIRTLMKVQYRLKPTYIPGRRSSQG